MNEEPTASSNPHCVLKNVTARIPLGKMYSITGELAQVAMFLPIHPYHPYPSTHRTHTHVPMISQLFQNTFLSPPPTSLKVTLVVWDVVAFWRCWSRFAQVMLSPCKQQICSPLICDVPFSSEASKTIVFARPTDPTARWPMLLASHLSIYIPPSTCSLRGSLLCAPSHPSGIAY
jgi:hypothetical protein